MLFAFFPTRPTFANDEFLAKVNDCMAVHVEILREFKEPSGRLSATLNRFGFKSIADLPRLFEEDDSKLAGDLYAMANILRHSSDRDEWKLAEWIYLNFILHPHGVGATEPVTPFVNLGKIYSRRGNDPLSQVFLDEGNKRFPDNGRLIFFEGILLRTKKGSTATPEEVALKYQTALNWAEQNDDSKLALEAHIALGTLLRELKKKAEAEVHFRAALGLAKKTGDTSHEIEALVVLGDVIKRSEPEEAYHLLTEAISLARKLKGKEKLELRALLTLGGMGVETQRLFAKEALSLARRLGDGDSERGALNILSRLDEAEARERAPLDIQHHLNLAQSEVSVESKFSETLAALLIAFKFKHPKEVARALKFLGRLMSSGQVTHLPHLFDEVLAKAMENGDSKSLLGLLRYKSNLGGNVVADYERTIEWAERRVPPDNWAICESLIRLAKLKEHADIDESLKLVEKAWSIASESQAVGIRVEIRVRMALARAQWLYGLYDESEQTYQAASERAAHAAGKAHARPDIIALEGEVRADQAATKAESPRPVEPAPEKNSVAPKSTQKKSSPKPKKKRRAFFGAAPSYVVS